MFYKSPDVGEFQPDYRHLSCQNPALIIVIIKGEI